MNKVAPTIQPKPRRGSSSDPDADPDAGPASVENRVKVLFPLPLFGPYDYLSTAVELPEPGSFVLAPLGPRVIPGVVWHGPKNAQPQKQVPLAKLKPISQMLPTPALAPEIIDFVNWVAEYTMFPVGAVLRMVMRSGDWLTPPNPQTAFQATGAVPEKLTPQRKAVMAALQALGRAGSAKEIADAAGASDGVVRGLAKMGVLETVDVDPDPPFKAPNLTQAGRDLTGSQNLATEEIINAVHARSASVILIDGVTGAGKTEVYLEAAAAALKDDPTAQVAILIPEIALTMPFLQRVEERFGVAPAPWHSDMTAATRRRVWRRALEGQARLVVGARSALFLPYKNLRMIVVDEEHDTAYKQEDGVIYHARDMAVARGARAKFPVILASATPSLETVINVASGRYKSVPLASRFGGAVMPDISLIDMRANPPEKDMWLSPALVNAVNEALVRGEQSLLFLNRRGYAPLTICRRCGHRMTAPDSDTCLVEHRFENRLVCHHTGFSMPKPDACPECNAVGGMAPCGPGVERVAEEAKRRWPDKRVEILSSDTAASPASLKAMLDEMRDGKIDILIATQVAAKGHNFPHLTLVGVVDADLGLSGGDLRAAERTYQLLNQVAGRAGRAEKPGRALLQTYQANAPVLEALVSGERDSFLAAEAEGRRQLAFPPFGRLAAIIMRSRDEAALKTAAKALRHAAPNIEGVEIWGPAPAPIYRLRGEARIRLLVKTRRDFNLQAYLNDWLRRVKTPNAVRRIVDIDPYSFL